MKKSYVIGFPAVLDGIRIPLGIKFFYYGTEKNAKKWLDTTMKKHKWDSNVFGGPRLFELKEVSNERD